ncbi:hypothetical protein C8Q76DRAFT_701673 [Earliella scabrosa]|nr:hypothetical protein C8Q76DRAFT_701673 [Earliella scabrosa]
MADGETRSNPGLPRLSVLPVSGRGMVDRLSVEIWQVIMRQLVSDDADREGTRTLGRLTYLCRWLQSIATHTLYHPVVIGPSDSQIRTFKALVSSSRHRATAVRALRILGSFADAALLCELFARLVNLADLSWEYPWLSALLCVSQKLRTFCTTTYGLDKLTHLCFMMGHTQGGDPRDRPPQLFPELRTLYVEGVGPSVPNHRIFQLLPSPLRHPCCITHLSLRNPAAPVNVAIEEFARVFGHRLVSLKITLHWTTPVDSRLFPTRILQGTSLPKLKHLELIEDDCPYFEMQKGETSYVFCNHNFRSCPNLKTFVWRWSPYQMERLKEFDERIAVRTFLLWFQSSLFCSWPRLERFERSVLPDDTQAVRGVTHCAFTRGSTAICSLVGVPSWYDDAQWLRAK